MTAEVDGRNADGSDGNGGGGDDAGDGGDAGGDEDGDGNSCWRWQWWK